MANPYAQYRDRFDQDGFVIVRDFLPAEELAKLRQMLDAVLDGNLKPQTTEPMDDFHIQWEPRVKNDPTLARRDKIRVLFELAHMHPFFWQFVTSQRVLDLVESLIGPNIRFYSDQTFIKPAKHGSEVPWHQDSSYWPGVEPKLLSVWLAVDDVTIDNGCVRFIPGTHKKELPSIYIHSDNPNDIGTDPSLIDASKEVPILLKAGSICVHHSLAVHRSGPNTSDKPRRGMVMIYLPADLKFHKPWDYKYGFKLVRGEAAEAGVV